MDLKPTITMMCGLPRSGKSTWVNINRTNKVIVSADSLRYAVYGQRYWQPGEPQMWAFRGIMLNELMRQGIEIIIDETNTTKARRKEILDIAKKYEYTVNCIYITNGKDECIKRAMQTNDTAIISTIERQAAAFQIPELDEGFENIDTIYMQSVV